MAVMDGVPRTADLNFTQLLSSEHVFFFSLCVVQCCFTSTETRKNIRDGEPRTATSTFKQLLSSEHVCFCLSFFSSVVQCCFTSTGTRRTIKDREAKDGHLEFHTAPEL